MIITMKRPEQEIFDVICHIIKKLLGPSDDLVIEKTSRLRSDVGLDSVDIGDLILDLESELNTTLNLSDLTARAHLWGEARPYDILISDLIRISLEAQSDGKKPF